MLLRVMFAGTIATVHHEAAVDLLSDTQEWFIREPPYRSFETLPDRVTTLLLDRVNPERIITMLDTNEVLGSVIGFDDLSWIFDRIDKLVLFHQDAIIVHPKHTE